MRIIDITPIVGPDAPVFPGDTAYSTTRVMEISDSCPVNVSRLTMSSHAGAHADAPLHYDSNGASIHCVGLEPYIGPVLVAHCFGGGLIDAPRLADAIEESGAELAPRILIRTWRAQPKVWDETFAAIGADAIDWLAMRGVVLIGVDTQSLDPATSKTMDAHHAIRRADMRVLENLLLDDVQPGAYELIALPLKIVADASPVRAILRAPW